jgi:AmmeMemoRadiSam system protein B
MAEMPVRLPAVAGQFYPGNPDDLRETIQRYLAEAALSEGLGNVRAVVAPHAGYVYSGPTAGYAFKALAALPKKTWTVFLLGPAHRVYFSGVALGGYSAFRTPLGDVPVATGRVREMLSRASLYVEASQAHVPEHCLEVEVPFLQVALSDMELVPMLFGQVDPQAVVVDLVEHVGDDDLIVVSSDLSHHHPYQEARQLDLDLLEALKNGDATGVLGGEACGRAPVVTLMGISSHKGWRPHVLDYRTSGDTAGDKWQVVGYASVAYTD